MFMNDMNTYDDVRATALYCKHILYKSDITVLRLTLW